MKNLLLLLLMLSIVYCSKTLAQTTDVTIIYNYVSFKKSEHEDFSERQKNENSFAFYKNGNIGWLPQGGSFRLLEKTDEVISHDEDGFFHTVYVTDYSSGDELSVNYYENKRDRTIVLQFSNSGIYAWFSN